MLVLSRGKQESLRIGSEIEVFVLEIRGDKVRLGIEAPKNVRILRGELEPFEPETPQAQKPIQDHPDARSVA